MRRKRDRLEVIYDILSSIKQSDNFIRPTKLLHISNVSPQMFAEYKDELLKKKFIQEIHESKSRIYIKLSKKGFEYIEDYKKIFSFIDTFGL